MYLFESICVEDGVIQNLEYHNERFNRTRKDILSNNEYMNLSDLVRSYRMGKYKLKIIYNENALYTALEPYVMRKVKKLKIVDSEHFDYSYKYLDRTNIDRLYSQRSQCDDIIIAVDKQLTDTSFSNIILYDGYSYYTPRKPLLNGTKRAKLLNNGFIKEADIKINEIKDFKYLEIINAMINPAQLRISIENIF